ncbi:histidine kinase dimerization/phosphoacceptor domain -containing protein [Ekhidna sp.]|uniref:histidine kinase dimerization/phosphoacceptor domain -containing protein n=1 Tax=Ekhidna sp. TaxID=2608089 RepID=UPI003B4FFF6E
MNSKWLPYDDSLDSYSRKEVSNLLRTFLYIIPLVAVILAAVNFSLGLRQIALSILSVPLFCLASFIALNKGMVNLSMVILIFILIASTTLSCTLGNGVHETGIMVLPIIVLFSSLVMNVRGVLITTITVILCLAYIVFGEKFGFYPSRNVPAVRWVDLVVVQTITIIHIFVTYTFSSITKKNLHRIQVELKNQQTYKEEIAQNLNEKTELLRLVHHRVKNNLLLINSLIELETHGKPEVKNGLSEITSSIHTIARAHDPLYHTKDYKQVEIKPYLEKLIATFIQSSGFNNIENNFEDELIFHENALLLGIILQKILSELSASTKNIGIVLVKINQKMQFNILFSESYSLSSGAISLITNLVDELKGELQISDDKLMIEFLPNKG